MGVENSNLNILIKTAAELAGAEQAAAALERDIGKAKALGQEYTHLEAKLKTARASIEQFKASQIGAGTAGVEAAQAATAATAADTEATKQATLGKHELKAAIKVLGHEFGALKGAAKFLFSPATIGIFALYQAYEALHRAVEKAREWKETLESHIDLSGMVQPLGEGLKKIDEAKVKTAEFFSEFERRSKDTKGFKDKADEIIKQLQRVAEEEKKLADAEAKRELARLELLKATKKISAEDYEAGKAAIEQNLIGKKSAIGKDLDKKTEAELASAAAQADFFIRTNTGKVGPANETAEAARQRLESLKKQVESMLKLAEAHLKQLTGEGEGKDRKEGLIDKYEKLSGWDIPNVFGFNGQKFRELVEGGKANEFIDRNKSRLSPANIEFIEKLQALWDKIQLERQGEYGAAATAREKSAQLPEVKSAADKAAAEAKEIQKQLEQAQKDKQALQEELARRKADTTATAPITAATDAANAEAARLDAEAKAAEAKAREEERARKEKEHEANRRAKDNDREVTSGDFSANIPPPPTDGTEALAQAIAQRDANWNSQLQALATRVDNISSQTRDALNT